MEDQNVIRFFELSVKLQEGKSNMKMEKAEFNLLHDALSSSMLQMDKRFIDQSGTGQGPFWTLTRSVQEGSFNKARLKEFFDLLIPVLKENQTPTTEALMRLSSDYLRQFEKKKLVLKPAKYCHRKDCQDLHDWLTSGSSA